jgi:hypothetical protein
MLDKNFKNSLFLVLVIILLWFNSCSSNKKYSKDEHLFTDVIGNKLYSESFRIDSYGVGGDVYSMYITDSLNFREFISLYYDNETIKFSVVDNEILAIKEEDISGINNPNSKKQVLQEYRFVINDLIEKGKFD